MKEETRALAIKLLEEYRDRLEAGIAVTLTKAEARELQAKANRVTKAIRELEES